MIWLWRWLSGEERADARRDLRRDPDLDLVKHMAEDHEYRLQLMERDLERINGGLGRGPYAAADRRQKPRH